jgi:O-antigen/teichoic acid export membrane protein
MVKKIKKLLQNFLFKGSLIVLSGNLVGSFINYLYHLIVGKLLVPEQYGLLTSFITLTYFTGILAGAFSLAIVNLISPLDNKKVIPTVKTIEKYFIKISLISWLITLFIYPVIKVFLHITDFSIYFIFSFQIFFSFLMIIYQAVLQGKLKFIKFSLLGVWASLLRIITAVGLIYLGFKAAGALAGLALAALGVIILGRFFIFNDSDYKTGIKTVSKLKTSFWQYSSLTLITNIALISIYSSDVLLVRHFFSSFESGIYAAASMLAKIIFFASNSLLIVAFPLFIKYRKEKSKLKTIFKYSLLAISLISILGVVFYNLFPHLIVTFLYNQNYNLAAQILPSFAVFIALVAVLSLFTHLLLALKSIMAPVVAGLAGFMQILLIGFNHQSLLQILKFSQVSMLIGLLLSMFFVFKTLNKSSSIN